MFDDVFTALALAEGDQNFTAEIEDNKFKGNITYILFRAHEHGGPTNLYFDKFVKFVFV